MNYFVITDGDHQVRNNVAFDKADTPPLIDVETATEDTSNNLDEEVALIEDTFVSDSHPIPSLNDVTTSTETFDMTSTADDQNIITVETTFDAFDAVFPQRIRNTIWTITVKHLYLF
jgi:hypothetical protein